MNTITTAWQLEHTYRGLPEIFYREVQPTAVKEPRLLLFNDELAQQLGLGALTDDPEGTAAILGGNELPPGGQPIAQAYMGHQFGHPNMLGDGRAILLGEQKNATGKRFDLQLKGAGRTPFSRRGDGRATLYSMLREYLMSEAMHGLGIPTSRSLAVVATGEPVFRRLPQAGAVLTRVMSSHLRVGTFEYARQAGDKEDILALTHYALERHFPELADVKNPGLALLRAVSQRQLELVIHWLRVGFIHGVMNTDNVSIPGETFDYGPCAFLNGYDLKTVFSSIDHQGRYAFGQQPTITHWNLAVFAGALLPIIAEEEQQAAELASEVLDEFSEAFRPAWLRMQLDKLGLGVQAKSNSLLQPPPSLPTASLGRKQRNDLDSDNSKSDSTDRELVQELLGFLRTNKADYTNTYAALTQEKLPEGSWAQSTEFKSWFDRWRGRLEAQQNPTVARELMRNTNPQRIPRNHLVEVALEAGVKGDLEPLQEMVAELANPYAPYPTKRDYRSVPQDFDAGYKTFCGT